MLYVGAVRKIQVRYWEEKTCRNDDAHLSIFSPAKLVPSSHLQSKFRRDPDLRSKQLCPIPVVLDLLLDLLTYRELFVLFLLHRRLQVRFGRWGRFVFGNLGQSRVFQSLGLIDRGSIGLADGVGSIARADGITRR